MKLSVNRRVLVIDDEPGVHEDFIKVLGAPPVDSHLEALEAQLFDRSPPAGDALGFEIASAYQGKEGVEMARSAASGGQPFTVAFVDMRMPPGWDGLQTVKALWEVDPRVQVVFCTAYSPYSWPEILQQLGGEDRLLIVKKPFDPIEIWQAATALSSKWALERRLEPAARDGRTA
jgi:CheY-like chemotaxis protein